MNKKLEIPRKRIGNIEVRECVASYVNKYEIIKWCEDLTTENRKYYYVISYIREEDNHIKIDPVARRDVALMEVDFLNYHMIIDYILDETDYRNIYDNSLRKDNEEAEGIKNDFADDKLRWDLLPFQEIEDIVRVYHFGAKKYKANSWQNLPDGFERYRGALLRHLSAYMNGERIDGESGLMHLAQVAWNAITLLWYDKHGKGLIPLEKVIVPKTNK